ncbi:MAG: IucA/IucC family C-terminal-domain containing protein [Candidatus Cohnella colombiensis]|uniref:IucA/IucC family C-terminal-domain containing protein n=1 Tax=Candidatus Cohnella colombiensis TaxID=3121368 RepID=A0AA95JAT7_9BACL|nr:MAG: IucA/IucC family C-terminal-domain containing protein [Cohnella sp.]
MDLSLFERLFHISTNGAEAPEISVPLNELLESEAKMLQFLQKGKELVRGIGLELAVSFTGLAFLGIAVTKQVVMSQYDRILDLSPSNLTIQIECHNGYPNIVFKIHHVRWTNLMMENRADAVITEWNQYFEQHFNPIIEHITAVAGLKPNLIWNQFGTRTAYVMNYFRENLPPDLPLQRLDEDFTLLETLPAQCFNRKRKNPFQHSPRFIDNPYDPGKQIMVRSACCLYDKRDNGVKCYNCPRLKEDDRAEKRAQIEAELVAKEAQKAAQ